MLAQNYWRHRTHGPKQLVPHGVQKFRRQSFAGNCEAVCRETPFIGRFEIGLRFSREVSERHSFPFSGIAGAAVIRSS